MQAIRAKSYPCARGNLRETYKGVVANCQKVTYNQDEFETSDADYKGDSEVPPDWVSVTTQGDYSMGELENSRYITGNFGEYDLTQGNFFCFDPYPEAETLFQ